MKIFPKLEQRTPEWFETRKGLVTGTGLKKIVGTKAAQESYYYEILAERLMVSDGSEGESPMDRGVRLENEARQAFEKKVGVTVEEVGFVQGFAGSGYSPDGLIKKGKKYTAGVEIKCLGSGNHVRAWLTNEVPDEHMPQIIQAMIVNEDLETMFCVFYDPRIRQHPLHIIKVERSEVEETIKEYKKAEKAFIAQVEETLAKIIKF
jgi:putative phage-type endonuclease